MAAKPLARYQCEVPAEMRAQRVLNQSRVPEIARYIIENNNNYCLSAITASVDGDIEFIPVAERGGNRNIGTLVVPMEARFIVNDGQHRRAALQLALQECPELADETIAVVLFIDAGLKRSQQMFADLNKHAVRPTRSLGILYDQRDPMAGMVRNLIQRVPVFSEHTELEKTTISNRSTKIFTLSNIYQATQMLLDKNKAERKVNAMVEIRKQDLNGASNLSGEGLKDLYQEIRNLYLSDDRPWIIGYSGGKDSTTALQAIWYAISELPHEKREKMVFVISSDTLVETPVIVDYIDNTLNRINKAAKIQGMPFQAEKVMPLMEDSFWTNLIGRGYPAPTTTFRWCTERMKIDPANRFILERVAEYGEVIMILGVRSDESATRAQVMSLHKITGNRLKRHSTLPRAYVYTPIENFTTNDVWTYLLQWKSPWGNNNRDLVALYKNSQAGECPLVIDTTTPSCGNSRFGCWVCTVVTQDKAMEAMIDNGEYWMEPLLELRDWLAATQDPEKKRDFRDYKRRNGRITLDRSNEQKVVPGPYFLNIRQKILRMVLQAQQSVRENGPDPNATLIHPEELHEIRRIWRMEEQDWEDSVPKIYREAMDDDLTWVEDDIGSFTHQDRSILKKICEERNIPPKLVMKLLDVELSMSGMAHRFNISKKLESVLTEEWQTEEEAIKRELKRRSRKASVQR